jgi:hypothetical protein
MASAILFPFVLVTSAIVCEILSHDNPAEEHWQVNLR